MERCPRSLVTWFVAPESGNQQLSSTKSGRVAIIAVMPPKEALGEVLSVPEDRPEALDEVLSPENEISKQ